MSIIDFPTDIPIRATGWSQDGGVVRQRSIFTGRTQDIRIGPAARWVCALQFVPTVDVAQLRRMRAFLAFAAQPGNGFRLDMVEAAQAVSPVPATALVNGAGQLGLVLNIDGLPNSTAILPAGALVSVALPGGSDEQAFTLTAAATSNGSGQAALALNQPLRASPADNAVVRLHWPRAVMRVGPDALNWAASPGAIYEFAALDSEEWF